MILINGRLVKDLSRELGISKSCLYLRLKEGWPIEKILIPRDLRVKYTNETTKLEQRCFQQK